MMFIVLFQFYPFPNPVYPTLASELRKLGHQVWIARQNSTGNLEWRDSEKVICEHPGPARNHGNRSDGSIGLSPLARINYLDFIFRARNYIKELQPDIVQINPASLNYVWLFPIFMPRQIHFLVDFRQPGQHAGSALTILRNDLTNFERRIFTRFIFQHACFCHPAGANVVLGNHWDRLAKIIPCGIDEIFLNYEHPHPAGEGHKPIRFLYIGTISRVRRLEVLLDAARKVLDHTDRFQLSLIGPDAAEGYYQNLVDNLQLKAVVSICPPVEYQQIPEILANQDVAFAYVPDNPPDWHYHPTLKVLEYRAFGIPIIATDNIPNRDFVQPGANGVLVQNQPEEIARAMLSFIDDPEMLGVYQRAALQMRQGVLWSEVAKKYETEVYQPLLSKGVP